MIQSFLNKTISKEVKEDDIIYFYGKDDEELLAESNLIENGISGIKFYDPKFHPFMTDEEKQQLIQLVQKTFQKEHLVLDVIIDYDSYYTAYFTVNEPKYNIAIHSTGMKVTIGYEGTIEDVSFLNEDVKIDYPETLISKAQAKEIIQQQQLLTLTIRPDIGWHYVYAPDFNIAGVETDGKVRYMSDMPEMEGVCFDPLPQVEAVEDLKLFLTTKRNASFEFYEDEDTVTWEIFSKEEEVASAGDPFEKACIALKTIVGDEYGRFHFENTANLYAALGMKDDEDVVESYRFVYIIDDISFDFAATTITVNTETNHIESISHSLIPYEKLKNLTPPTITLEEANAVARKLVDVELSLSREGFGSTEYTFDYIINYPTSPTKGNIHYVDAWTGKVHFVETGLQ